MVYLKKEQGRMFIKCPRVANFIEVDGVYRPLSYLTEEEITIVAEEWSMQLADRRKEQIANKKLRRGITVNSDSQSSPQIN